MDYEVIICGAGASGLLCALACARRGRRVAVLDHGKTAARKVRASGGGRCNVTNAEASAPDYACANPHFVKSALARFGPADILALLQGHDLSFTAEPGGKRFCAQGAPAVAKALESEARAGGAALLLGQRIEGVRRDGDAFRVAVPGRELACHSLVVATGGVSWPKLGATDLGYTIAKAFGLAVTELLPGLAPLTAPPDVLPFCRELAGVSLPVILHGTETVADDLLFTHKGVSGPAVLDASLFWREGQTLTIDFLPGTAVIEALAGTPRLEVKNALGRLLPKRLAEALCIRHGWHGTVAGLPKKGLLALEATLHAWPFAPAGTEGFDKAEVTLGGVDTAGVSSKTMEAKAVPGLFVIGEVLDVTGRLGGFNLQWAWSSGFAAGQYA